MRCESRQYSHSSWRIHFPKNYAVSFATLVLQAAPAAPPQRQAGAAVALARLSVSAVREAMQEHPHEVVQVRTKMKTTKTTAISMWSISPAEKSSIGKCGTYIRVM